MRLVRHQGGTECFNGKQFTRSAEAGMNPSVAMSGGRAETPISSDVLMTDRWQTGRFAQAQGRNGGSIATPFPR
jgi:hypothetical protein